MLLLQPETILHHLTLMPFDPLGGLMSLYAAYMAFVIKPALLIYALGIVLYYRLRGSPKRIDSWTGASVLTYIWMPHIFLVALGIICASLGCDNALWLHHKLPVATGARTMRLIIEYAPLLAMGLTAERAVRLREVAAPAVVSIGYGAKALMSTVGLLLVIALLIRFDTVKTNWDALRPVTPGDFAPAFVLRHSGDGSPIDHTSLQGHVTLIDFWATWCAPCVAAMPGIADLARELAPKGLRVLSVNVEPNNLKEVRAFAQQHHLPFEVYVDDGAMQHRYKIRTFPTALVTDPSGRVHRLHMGTTSISTLRNSIMELLSTKSKEAP